MTKSNAQKAVEAAAKMAAQDPEYQAWLAAKNAPQIEAPAQTLAESSRELDDPVLEDLAGKTAYPAPTAEELLAAMGPIAAAPPMPKPVPVNAGSSALRGDIRGNGIGDELTDDLSDMARAPEGQVRKRKGSIDKFAIPAPVIERYKQAGWSLEWKRHTTYGQGDPSYQVALAENGWIPVDVSELPGYMPPEYKGAIVRDGNMLMKRPLYLTEEARREDTTLARNMIRAKEQQLGQTPAGQLTRDHPTARAVTGVTRDYGPIEVPKD